MQREWTLKDLCKQMWVFMMSAVSHAIGDTYDHSTCALSGSLDLCDRMKVRHDIPKITWGFLQTNPFYQMSSRQNLLTSGGGFLLPQER